MNQVQPVRISFLEYIFLLRSDNEVETTEVQIQPLQVCQTNAINALTLQG